MSGKRKKDTCDVCGNDTTEPRTDATGNVYCPSCWRRFKEAPQNPDGEHTPEGN